MTTTIEARVNGFDGTDNGLFYQSEWFEFESACRLLGGLRHHQPHNLFSLEIATFGILAESDDDILYGTDRIEQDFSERGLSDEN